MRSVAPESFVNDWHGQTGLNAARAAVPDQHRDAGFLTRSGRYFAPAAVERAVSASAWRERRTLLSDRPEQDRRSRADERYEYRNLFRIQQVPSSGDGDL
jgi:hypothetical protein